MSLPSWAGPEQVSLAWHRYPVSRPRSSDLATSHQPCRDCQGIFHLLLDGHAGTTGGMEGCLCGRLILDWRPWKAEPKDSRPLLAKWRHCVPRGRARNAGLWECGLWSGLTPPITAIGGDWGLWHRPWACLFICSFIPLFIRSFVCFPWEVRCG